MNSENNQANQVISRIMEIYKVSSDVALSAEINIPAQSISTWRRRDSTPFELCLKISNEKNIDLNWLLKGHGSMYKSKVKEQSPTYQTKSIEALATLFDRVDELEKEIAEIRKQS